MSTDKTNQPLAALVKTVAEPAGDKLVQQEPKTGGSYVRNVNTGELTKQAPVQPKE